MEGNNKNIKVRKVEDQEDYDKTKELLDGSTYAKKKAK